MISNNLARRHLSESQRAAVAAEIANLDHGIRAGSQTGQLAGLDLGPKPPAPVTQAQAADMLSVSERAVRRAVVVRDKGVPELKEKLRAGEIAVSAAAEIAKAPAEEQAAIVALPADQRVEKLKAMRAETKAIRGRAEPSGKGRADEAGSGHRAGGRRAGRALEGDPDRGREDRGRASGRERATGDRGRLARVKVAFCSR